MKNTIELGPGHSLDLPELIDTRLLIQANSGAGKTWSIVRLVEQSYGKTQIIIIDPEGEFSALRKRYDFVLAAKGGDTPADPRSAALLAKKLLELRVSAVIDLYELSYQDKKHFVRLFLDALVNAPKELWPINYSGCLVIIDEAHKFAPEKSESEALAAVESLTSLGRKRGLCAVLATQRISKLHKDAAAECNNKMVGRCSLDLDRKRAAEELAFSSKEETLSLRTLAPGEFYAFGPAISDEVIKLKVGEIQTVYKLDKHKSLKPIPPTANIKALLPKLSDLPAEAKKEALTISDMQQQIRNLTQENAALKRQPKATDPEAVEKAVKQELQKHITAFSTVENAYKNKVKSWKEYSQKMIRLGYDFAYSFKQVAETMPDDSVGARYAPEVLPKPKAAKFYETSPGAIKPENNSGKMTAINPDMIDQGVSAPQQKILNALMWAETLNLAPTDKTQLALLADASPSSSGYTNNLGTLRTAGLITYPRPGTVGLTEQGRSKAQQGDIPQSSQELHEQIFHKLPAPQVKILKALIIHYPDPVEKTQLAMESDASPTSSGYTNNLGRLRSLKLIDYPSPGMVVATEVLFI